MKWATSIFLFWLTATASGQQPSGDDEKADTPGQLNLLFILADNQPASLLGVYGNPDIRTPNIDQLAAEGTRFTGVFAVNGMCSPTRATLMTGLMPSQHGVHNWLDDAKLQEWPRDWSAVREFRTLPLTLGNRGYQTALIGKWHLGQPWQASIGYQHWLTFSYGHTLDFWDNTIIDNEQTYPVNDQHIVDFFADQAVEYLRNIKSEQPFYLQLNLDGPYLNPPTNTGPARNRHYESYLGSDFESFPRVPVNPNLIEQLLDPELPEFLRGMKLQSILHHNDPESMANVASQNTIVDDAVGRVMAALREAGLDQNTLVIYSADQGNFYGQHGLWHHTTATSPSNLYEAALNIPLIVRHLGSTPAGETRDVLIGQYDLPATILDYLGFGEVEFEGSPGRSFVGVLSGASTDWLDEVYYEQEETRGVRTRDYAYWKRIDGVGGRELYDMQRDLGQHKNLIGDPQYREVVARLDERLTIFFGRYSTPKYDLWAGGTAKGSVSRPGRFQNLYGEDWQTVSESLPPFEEH